MSRIWGKRHEIMAIAVVLSYAVGVEPLIVYGAAAVVLAYSAWSSRRSVAGTRTARLLVVLAVAGETWTEDSSRWPLLASGVLLALFLVVAQAVHQALNISHLTTVNLEVRRSLRERCSAPGAAAVSIGALSMLYVLTAAAPASIRPAADPGLLVVTVALLAWIGSTVLGNYLRRKRESHPIDKAVVNAVEELSPKFIVHFGGAVRSEYQIQMWLPYFDRIGDPYLVLVRDPHLLAGTAACTEAPIVVARTQTVLDKLLPESVRACFYSNHAQKNTALIRHGEYLHVQLMHGDSDKAISRSALALMYDRVFVAGQAGVDRYHRHGVDIPDYKFRKIGRPQLHGIRVGERDGEHERPTVLYTPTWTGFTEDVNYSSLREGRRIVEALLARDVDVIFRTHPYTKSNAAYFACAEEIRERIAADAARTGRNHRWGKVAEEDMTLNDCINAADAAISDISGSASDWLYGGRPFAMTDPKGLGEDYLEEFPLAEGAYLLEADADNIEQVLDELLIHDSKAELRAETRRYYLGDIAPEDLFDVFADAVRETYAAPVEKPASGRLVRPRREQEPIESAAVR